MKRVLVFAGAILLLVLINMQSPPAGAQVQTPEPPPPDQPVVVQIEYDSFEQLSQLVSELDVWEVHRDKGFLVAYVHSDQYRTLVSAGYRMSVDQRSFSAPETIPGYPCYRTIDELNVDLQEVATQFPSIAQLSTIGSSYEGRPLQVIRLTNRNIEGNKPVLFLMSNIHGRELITPEAAMVFVDYLTNNYGSNPDVTWLLDYQEIHVLVSANPDGHIKNEPGYPWTFWRKNTHPDDSCSSLLIGVDLNRNHSFLWGCCNGSSANSCAETYRGPTVGSEPETQALENYLRSIFPDQRGPGNEDAAPLDASGVLITLHSYGNLVLWPWGWTGDLAPNSSGLSALGRKMAAYNGYSASQSISLYPTDGTSDDWSYGELGIASYTFELGSSSDGIYPFYPSCSRYDAIIQPNILALIYAAKVARTPYMTAHGPDALDLTVPPPGVFSSSPVITATIDDSGNGSNLVTAAEYYIDIPPWEGGVPNGMQASDGGFDEVREDVWAALASEDLSECRHTIFVRGEDDSGNWGTFSAIYYLKDEYSSIRGRVTDAQVGASIAGATVDMLGDTNSCPAITDVRGEYAVTVISGTYTATVSASGYISQTVPGIVASSGITLTQDFALTPLDLWSNKIYLSLLTVSGQ